MNTDEQLARLLRLKRHEKPNEDYFEGFLDAFHAYQRKAIATQSVTRLAWERLCTALSAFRRPTTAWAAVGAYAAVMLLIQAWPVPDHAKQTTVLITSPSATAPLSTPTAPNQSPALLPESNASGQTALPIEQTITVSDGPGPKPPALGKRRTADQQPQQLPSLNSPRPNP